MKQPSGYAKLRIAKFCFENKIRLTNTTITEIALLIDEIVAQTEATMHKRYGHNTFTDALNSEFLDNILANWSYTAADSQSDNPPA